MVITNQGVAIQSCFQQAKHIQFCKTGQYVAFIKTRTKYASKDGIELAVLKAFREVLIAVLLVDRFSLVHTVIYDAHNKHTITKKK